MHAHLLKQNCLKLPLDKIQWEMIVLILRLSKSPNNLSQPRESSSDDYTNDFHIKEPWGQEVKYLLSKNRAFYLLSWKFHEFDKYYLGFFSHPNSCKANSQFQPAGNLMNILQNSKLAMSPTWKQFNRKSKWWSRHKWMNFLTGLFCLGDILEDSVVLICFVEIYFQLLLTKAGRNTT